jgi:glycosidase
MAAFYKGLFEMRAQTPALTSGNVLFVSNSQPDSMVTFERRKDADSILVLVNTSNRKCAGSVESTGNYARLLAGQGDSFDHGRYQVSAFGYVVAKRKRD